MDVKFRRMDEEIGETTSVYVGRCNRNPCKFMNREILTAS